MSANESQGDLIRTYAFATIEGLVNKVKGTAGLRHNLTKGQLRELFVAEILRPFLAHQFDIGSGVVINQRGDQSRQIDIVIFDRSIMPPLITQGTIGVYPAESVVATMEVKSRLVKKSIIDANASARLLHEVVYDPAADEYGLYDKIRPACALIGFYGQGTKDLKSQETGAAWLSTNASHLVAICLLGRDTWIRLGKPGWRKSTNTIAYEESRRFISVFLDNCRTLAARRMKYLGQFEHKDWIGLYIREKQ